MAMKPGRRYAIRTTTDDGRFRQVARLNTGPLKININVAQQRTSIEDSSYIPAPYEVVLYFNLTPIALMQEILQNFTKRELISLLLIDNVQWQTCIKDVLHMHQSLFLFIGSEEEVKNPRHVLSDISADHLNPPSAESVNQQPEFLRYDQLNTHIVNRLTTLFPLIRVLKVQVISPSFLSTPYLIALLNHYANQLETVHLSFVNFVVVPFTLLKALSGITKLRHLTLNFPVGVWEYTEDIIPDLGRHFCQALPQLGIRKRPILPTLLQQAFPQLETIHLSLATAPPLYRLLIEKIANNPMLREIALDLRCPQPNAVIIHHLPMRTKARIVKLELWLYSSNQLSHPLLVCLSSLRVISLQRTVDFSFVEMLAPLGELPQLRHLKFRLGHKEIRGFWNPYLSTQQVASSDLPTLSAITSLTLILDAIDHHTLINFPFYKVFTGVRWIDFRYSKYYCNIHPWASGDVVRKACAKILLRPLAACGQLRKIYAISYRLFPNATDPNADTYIQTTGDEIWYEFTPEEVMMIE